MNTDLRMRSCGNVEGFDFHWAEGIFDRIAVQALINGIQYRGSGLTLLTNISMFIKTTFPLLPTAVIM